VKTSIDGEYRFGTTGFEMVVEIVLTRFGGPGRKLSIVKIVNTIYK
jgi:hypothetical protein